MVLALAQITTYEALPGRVVLGMGAISSLPDEVDHLGAHRVLVIDGLLDEAVSRSIVRELGSGCAATVRVTRQHVPAGLAGQVLAQVREQSADLLISVGGGSALGVAKAVARETGLPILAVPTTYAGSEMTPIWGITDDGVKTTGHDLRVLPRVVIYDPELTVSLPPAASGASGMNAVAHCVEALWTERANPVTDAVALHGLGLLSQGLPAVVAEPEDLTARELSLRGAWLGGMALAGAGTALHHKICHVLGGAFDLPHAETHAAVLPWVADHFRQVAPDALSQVARSIGAADPVDGLLGLAASVGATAGLAELGLDGAGADRAAVEIAASAPAVPVAVTAAEVRALLDRAMDGAGAAVNREHQQEEAHG